MLFDMGQLWSTLDRESQVRSREKERAHGVHSKECHTYTAATGHYHIPCGFFETPSTLIDGRALVEFPPGGKEESSSVLQSCMEEGATTDR